MGSPVSVTVANVVIEDIEHNYGSVVLPLSTVLLEALYMWMMCLARTVSSPDIEESGSLPFLDVDVEHTLDGSL